MLTMLSQKYVVLAITKVLNWKLITTQFPSGIDKRSCTSYYEGTELKANHNAFGESLGRRYVVLAITKVLNA